MNELGKIMKACREKAMFSQFDMAFKINRSQSCISKFESNKKIPDIDTFIEWMEVTNCKEVAISYLYEVDGIVILNEIINKQENRELYCDKG